jgi:hypothetical protein
MRSSSASAELGQVAAQQAVLDVVERVFERAHLEARSLEERTHCAQVRRARELGSVAQHHGVEDVEPERGLRRNGDPLQVERFQLGEAGGDPRPLVRSLEPRVIAGAARVEMRLPRGGQGLHELGFHMTTIRPGGPGRCRHSEASTT